VQGDLEKRIARAAESILDNEALTSDLDDDAADLFLKWALGRVEEVARSTSSLGEEDAEEAMAIRLKAIRQIARYVNTWGDDPQAALENIILQAKTLYGEAFSPPIETNKTAFIEAHRDSEPVHLVAGLQELLQVESLESGEEKGADDFSKSKKLGNIKMKLSDKIKVIFGDLKNKLSKE
jgi:hypothetical protein